jgi:hypothetical protein
VGNATGIKHDYCNETWNQEEFTYDPKPQEFIGVSEPSIMWNQFSTMMQMFHLFWSFHILWNIINETNWYATTNISEGVFFRGDT